MIFFEEDPNPAPKETSKPITILQETAKEDLNAVTSIFENILFSKDRMGVLPKDIGHTVAGFARKCGYSPVLTEIDKSSFQIRL